MKATPEFKSSRKQMNSAIYLVGRIIREKERE